MIADWASLSDLSSCCWALPEPPPAPDWLALGLELALGLGVGVVFPLPLEFPLFELAFGSGAAFWPVTFASPALAPESPRKVWLRDSSSVGAKPMLVPSPKDVRTYCETGYEVLPLEACTYTGCT